jgi:hypothetical protein
MATLVPHTPDPAALSVADGAASPDEGDALVWRGNGWAFEPFREDSLGDSRWGLSLDGTDDSAAIAAAFTEFVADGGGVMYGPRAVVGFASDIDVPDGVSLVGLGSGATEATAATTFKALAAGAQLRFSTGGGVTHRENRHGGFRVDGNSVATNPVYIGQAVDCAWHDMFVTGAATDGIGLLIEYCQNSLFQDFWVDGNRGIGVKIDYGAGGLLFSRFESNGNRTYNLYFGSNSGVAHGAYAKPTHITLETFLIERWLSGDEASFVRQVQMDDGALVTFSKGRIADASATTARSMVKIDAGDQIRFDGGSIDGTAGQTTALVLANGTRTILDGNVQLGVHTVGISHATGAVVEAPSVRYNNVTTLFSGTGSNDTVVRNRIRSPLEITRGSTSEQMVIGLVSGEAGQRVFITPNGYNLGAGTGFSADVGVQRNAANRLDLVATTTRTTGAANIVGAFDHDGSTFGALGATPAAQQAANADTSGATLAELETEVNQLKALLRTFGFLAS